MNTFLTVEMLVSVYIIKSVIHVLESIREYQISETSNSNNGAQRSRMYSILYRFCFAMNTYVEYLHPCTQ